MVEDVTKTKPLADFDALTPEIDKEVSLYDGEGEIRCFWRARQFGSFVIVETRKPGKAAKLVSIEDRGRDYAAESWIEEAVKDRENRVPVIRKEKAEAKLAALIKASNVDMWALLAWSRTGMMQVLFKDHAEIMEDHFKYWDIKEKPESEHIAAIASQLRHQGGSYFGGLKLARRFIDQLKPGGLADKTVAGVIEMVEKHLVPWAYIAGAMGEPVMKAQKPRELAIGLIERHTHRPCSDMGFFPDGTTAEALIERVYSNAVEDVKPGILDALTLE
jgi:hypothetical protein